MEAGQETGRESAMRILKDAAVYRTGRASILSGDGRSQINLSRKQPDFTMERCVYQAEIVGTGTGSICFGWVGIHAIPWKCIRTKRIRTGGEG